MKEILRTKNKWVAGTCFIVGLMLVLMLSTAVFFFVTLGLLDLRGPELAILGLPVDEAAHDVVDGAD